jgi:hypothetical protein
LKSTMMFAAFAAAITLTGCGGGSDQAATAADEPIGSGAASVSEAPAADVPEGFDSPADAVSAYFDALADSDLGGAWAALDPEMRDGMSRSGWDACMASQSPEVEITSIDFEESEQYTEDDSVFSTGAVTSRYSSGDDTTQPGTFKVAERAGGWFVVKGTVRAGHCAMGDSLNRSGTRDEFVSDMEALGETVDADCVDEVLTDYSDDEIEALSEGSENARTKGLATELVGCTSLLDPD